MFKKIVMALSLTTIATAFWAGILALTLSAEAPVEKAKVIKHGRGHVKAKNLAELRARSNALHGHRLRAIPKVTAASWDCRTLGYVPPIVDQGQCGSCWDFSGTGVSESALIKAGILKNDGSGALSEQYTLDCGNNGGCNGDDNTTVLAWALKTGLPLTSAYGPYQAEAGKCKYTSAMTLYKISQWGFAGNESGVTAVQDIKNAMVTYGPIGCAVAAGGGWWDSGTGTDTGTSRDIDHDVILVGWDDTHDNGDSTKGAWIMRNSWGTSWGVGGYAWMKYGADSIGTEAVWASATPPAPVPNVPVINSSLTASAVVGVPFTYQISASNAPQSWAAAPLPAWLTISSYGILSGTPQAPETDTIVLSAINAAGTGTASLTLTVTTTPPPPSPTPIPSNVTITLTTDQVQSVIGQSGSVVIHGSMTLIELMAALQKCSLQPPPQMPCQTCPPPAAK
jgi:Papain family cysteine protease